MIRPALALLYSVLVLLAAATCSWASQVEPVKPFDINRYAGTWYEIYRLDHRFERGLTNVTATYRLIPGGRVEVINRGLNRSDCHWKSAKGTAAFRGNSDVADLRVTFFWPFSGAYRVFALDQSDYRWAAVAGPNRNYLWILSRSPTLPESIRKQLIDKASKLGFPTNNLIRVDHSKPRSCGR